MHTRCPHCLTLFRISDVQLKAADGKVHCCRCHQVFNALDNLEEGIELPEPDPVSILEELVAEAEAEAEAEASNLPIGGGMENAAMEEMTDVHSTPPQEANDTVTPATDSVGENSELKRVDLQQFLSNTGGTIPEIEPSKSALENENNLPFRIPSDLPEIDAIEEKTISSDEIYTGQQTSNRGTLAWSLLITLFLLLTLGQLSWFGRKHLIQYPEGRQLLELACRHVGCQLPLRKAIDEIAITDRSIGIHPDNDNALLVVISFINKAGHPQPYPALQLSFYGSNEQLAAQRVFQPAEYLQRPADRKGLFLPGAQVQVQLELEDPGEENTGFKFDFL
ncbi:MAG: DUF3426 domain-containing protein [Candidatus Sedimenticola sp. (ex Thyasira tokunagai)]